MFDKIYSSAKVEIIHEGERRIQIRWRVRHGDVISAKIFVAALENACSELDWEIYGMRIDGE